MSQQLIVLFPLFWMMLCDVHYRRIDIWSLLLFGVIQFFCGCWSDFVMNGLVLTSMMVFLRLFVSLRYGRKASLNYYFGEGDYLFLLLLGSGFFISDFVRFLIGSFFFSFLYGLTVGRYVSLPMITTVGFCYTLLLSYNTQTYEVSFIFFTVYYFFERYSCPEYYTHPIGGLFGNEGFNVS